MNLSNRSMPIKGGIDRVLSGEEWADLLQVENLLLQQYTDYTVLFHGGSMIYSVNLKDRSSERIKGFIVITHNKSYNKF